MSQRTAPQVLIYDPSFSEVAKAIEGSVTHCVSFDSNAPVGVGADTVLRDSVPAPPTVDIRPEDPAFINFTSGSTGTPKGILHTHRDAIECAHLGQYLFRARSDDVFLHFFTPSFIAWSNATFPFLAVGAKILMLPEFDPDHVARIVERESVSVLYAVPTQLKMLLQADIGKYDTSSVRLCGFGGETLSRSALQDIRDAITDNLFFEYGTTEVMHSGSALLPEQLSETTLGSVGRPLPGVELRLIEVGTRDPTAPVPEGETGEIIVRGPSVASEVWDDPEMTNRYFHPEGWWFSGDLGRVGDDGNLYVVGRADNMFKSGGLKVYAETVENTIEEHPDIAEVAVIGIPDETFGRSAKAFVVRSDTALTVDDLESWCRDHAELPGYQRPRTFEFVETLPRTNTGKLDRTPLLDPESSDSQQR